MFLQIQDIIDLQTLVESEQVEFKLAGGRDGKGELPKDFWPTYSAMANGRGGWVILGVTEQDGIFTPVGVIDPQKIKTDLFNQLNDKERVSTNVLKSEKDVQLVCLQGKTVLAIHISPAMRKQKPVHLKKSPFGNTYQRLHEGDRLCDDITVKRMLAEQIHDSRDNEVLSEHYNFDDDIDLDSLKIYRNLLSSNNPQHPYLACEPFELLKMVGGWRKDRETGKQGITLAGILMFGKWEAITAALPNYMVDYQERPEAKTELRWVDRITPDGTWSGNLFDFYRRVYQRLVSELKVPFTLEEGQRKTDTPIHIALREALINTLVHADFSDRVSVLIVKRPDMFGFRNPGLMRLPLEDVIMGGTSDCRNRLLHQMFLLIGLGEKAGSGMPKIFSGWKSANWRIPKLWEKTFPAQTLLELSTASLIPQEILELLHRKFGERFEQLDDFEQVIIATAALEGWVNHERACQLTTKHPREVTLTLPRLESKGFLLAGGEQKSKYYTLPGVSVMTPDEVFSQGVVNVLSNSPYNEKGSTHNGQSFTYKDAGRAQGAVSVEDIAMHEVDREANQQRAARDEHGRMINRFIDLPYIDSVNNLSEHFRNSLFEQAEVPREKLRLGDKELMKSVILTVCSGHFISVSALGEILNRNPNALRQQYLKPLVDNGQLKLAFPQFKNHSKQGYSKA
ncbi:MULTISPECIES: RNA-binding domain-containing protein [unclassified Pantoea]|uniref:RNA-binding domain-containing protein n=1 Tax=unclassified Pantoea TaxID=2630326 RepID=UPI00123192C2|nr:MULTISPECIES: RNA-binding domain-containing protein [unclassified Pantoea]KAA5952513.1 AAA family ATPase [Pantoea sp. VH_24]KAA5959794.1 AAA family ATPase [Pantoea sp. VH_16]KAA5962041.1 AAA family ATPase [Pantoea sp. VH_18]KAA5995001.1 AAA family ATPase [Pantoea sp. M_1]KAA6002255.1 AAA family ATPase [Pantoea sp. F_7]